MATVDRSSFWSEEKRALRSQESEPRPPGAVPKTRLHRVGTVRRQQGLSLRSAARQLGKDVRNVRHDEEEETDLRLSELYGWQQVLGVPLVDLLVDPGTALSRPVLERARMVRIMKTVKALVDHVETKSARRLVQTLQTQLVEIMPELEEVGAWHTVGQRRSLDEFGRAAERVVPDDVFQRFDRR
jgi:transcriptional regulator with XRE-family HTH domain